MPAELALVRNHVVLLVGHYPSVGEGADRQRGVGVGARLRFEDVVRRWMSVSANRAREGGMVSGLCSDVEDFARRMTALIAGGVSRMYPNMISTRREKTSVPIAPVSNRTSSRATSATPFAISPVASAKGVSTRATRAPMRAPRELPHQGNEHQRCDGQSRKRRERQAELQPGRREEQGARRAPSAALRIPGAMSRRTW